MNNFFTELKPIILAGVSLAFLFMVFPSNAFATWSIIILEEETGTIGIAGASCSYMVYGIGEMVPGEGAVIAQAASNMMAKEKAIGMIRQGFSHGEIIAAITDPEFDHSFRHQQYAVVTFTEFDDPLTFTGERTPDYHGALTTKGVSVQGNTLVSEEVLKSAFEAATADGEISGRLMQALLDGAMAGGDVRCGDQKATSAFITLVKADDVIPEQFLNLVVSGLDRGGDNAVEKLQEIFLEWKENQTGQNTRVVCRQKMPGKTESYECE